MNRRNFLATTLALAGAGLIFTGCGGGSGGGGGAAAPWAGSDGLIYVGGDYDLARAKPDGTAAKLTDTPGRELYPEVSRDGKKISFYVADLSSGNGGFTANIDGTGKTKLPVGNSYSGGLSFSPDGSRVLFIDDTATPHRLKTVRTDGTGVQDIAEMPTAAFEPRYSPDGAKIAYFNNLPGNSQLWTIDADGTNPKLVKSLGGVAVFDWLPDGRLLYQLAERQADLKTLYFLETVLPDGTNATRIRALGQPVSVLRVSPDGFYFLQFPLAGVNGVSLGMERISDGATTTLRTFTGTDPAPTLLAQYGAWIPVRP